MKAGLIIPPSFIQFLTSACSEFSETLTQAYFYANFWFCTRTFPAGDSNLRQYFFSNSLKTPEDDSGSPNLASTTKDQKIAANPCPRVCHKMSSRPRAVGVISFSSWPIRMSHSDCVFIDRTIITPMKI